MKFNQVIIKREENSAGEIMVTAPAPGVKMSKDKTIGK